MQKLVIKSLTQIANHTIGILSQEEASCWRSDTKKQGPGFEVKVVYDGTYARCSPYMTYDGALESYDQRYYHPASLVS